MIGAQSLGGSRRKVRLIVLRTSTPPHNYFRLADREIISAVEANSLNNEPSNTLER